MTVARFPREHFAGLDWDKLRQEEDTSTDADALRELQERAAAALAPFVPITPEERFRQFAHFNYRPNGLYLPDDGEMRGLVRQRLTTIGDIEALDERLRAYHHLQDETEKLAVAGIAGRWTGQQALSRSCARFRIAGYGRRGGKTFHGAHEALGIALFRPRSTVWIAAPVMRHVSRAFNIVVTLIRDYKIPYTTMRNSDKDKLIVLENGSVFEGISLDSYELAAGAAVDYLLLDEAAQVTEEAWTRACLPPLADRNGTALLISSYEGEGDFFHTKSVEAKREAERLGSQSAWEFFRDASYDINFYVFPKGRQSEFLVQAQKEMPWMDFLEQFGAIPASERDRVFPEYRDRVHLGDFPFNPDKEVFLAADPSGGSSPYAIAALQDYGSYIIQIDELYETHATAEEMIPMVDARPWRENVEGMVFDSAWPAEIERWANAGFPAFPVHNKPKIRERLPFHRNLLRDPMRFRALYRRMVNEILMEMGREPDTDYDLDEDQQKSLIIQVEQALSDEQITAENLRDLRSCARLHVDRRCVHTVWEYKNYKFARRKIANRNWTEDPADNANHIMDAVGYYVWQFHRYGHSAGGLPESYLEVAGGYFVPNIPQPDEGAVDSEDDLPDEVIRSRRFLREVRGRFRSQDSGMRSMLLPCR